MVGIKRRVTAADYDLCPRTVLVVYPERKNRLDETDLLGSVFHHLEMIRNNGSNLILASLQLLHIPKVILPPRQRSVLPLQIPSLNPKPNSRPDASTKVRRQSPLVYAYFALLALRPVLLRKLSVRYSFYRMVYATRGIASRVVLLENRGGEVGRRGIIGYEFCVPRIEAGDAVAEKRVCA